MSKRTTITRAVAIVLVLVSLAGTMSACGGGGAVAGAVIGAAIGGAIGSTYDDPYYYDDDYYYDEYYYYKSGPDGDEPSW
jgi:hypothetical protein